MRIVIGIDPNSSPASTLNLLGRLSFRNAEAVYASCAAYPAVPASGFAISGDELLREILDEKRKTARSAMQAAVDDAADRIPGRDMVFLLGDPAHMLGNLSEDLHAGLIAIGSRIQSRLQAVIHGSTGKGLTLNARRSVLIAKGDVPRAGTVKAVFAYDGSECCDRSIDLLIQMCPQGLTHIDVVIVDTPDKHRSPVIGLRGESGWYLGPEKRRELLLSYAQPAADRLSAAGFETRAVCLTGESPIAIEGAVVDLHADLVIMGAQGHGFVERLIFGSFALEQVLSEPHSVLVLRPK